MKNQIFNADSITTDAHLERIIDSLGFVSVYDPLRVPDGDTTVNRTMLVRDNDLFSHVALAVEKGAFIIFFFNEMSQRFAFYASLQGDVSASVLRETLMKASRWEGIDFSSEGRSS